MENVNINNEKDLINFLRLKIEDLTKTSNQFDSTDVYSEKWDLIAELKSRTTHYDEILIEKIKYEALINSNRKNKRYIVSTPKAIYSFNIEKLKFVEDNWFLKLLPETTYFKDKPNYIYKECNLIHIKNAKILYEFK